MSTQDPDKSRVCDLVLAYKEAEPLEGHFCPKLPTTLRWALSSGQLRGSPALLGTSLLPSGPTWSFSRAGYCTGGGGGRREAGLVWKTGSAASRTGQCIGRVWSALSSLSRDSGPAPGQERTSQNCFSQHKTSKLQFLVAKPRKSLQLVSFPCELAFLLKNQNQANFLHQPALS